MNIESARRIERAPIEIGRQYPFFAEMQQEYEPPEKRMRNYTGQLVTVIAWTNKAEFEEQEAAIREEVRNGQWPSFDEAEREFGPRYLVRAKDGFEFEAQIEELNDWDRDLGQFFWPDATYGPRHDRAFLSNEAT